MILYLLFFMISAFSFICFDFKLSSVFQQCGYRLGEFFSCAATKAESLKTARFSCLYTLALLTLSAVSDDFPVTVCLFAVLGIGIPFAYALAGKTVKRVKFTARFTRIYVLAVILFSGLCFSAYFPLAFLEKLGFGEYSGITAVGFCSFFIPLLLPLSATALYPLDRAKYLSGKRKCAEKLKSRPDLTVIGITGSAGKTSVKNYLFEMLSRKYTALKTPESYNTPLGICKTVEKLGEEHEIFVCEMGARRAGDIKEICEMVRPKIGVITAITEQHTATLGGIEGVKRTKYELIEELKGGFAVFSSDTSGSAELYEKCEKEKYLAGINGKDVRAENVVLKEGKILFDIVIFGKKYSCSCFLLGRHAVTDICVAAAVASKLGVKDEDIVIAISGLKGEKHRLEEIKTPSGITVIDDGYNANIEGIRAAAEVLAAYKGGKIVVTAGIVESDDAERINEEVGKAFSGAADKVIAFGKNADAIARGFSGETVKTDSVGGAKKILGTEVKSGDVVLFANDIPDRYL